MSPTRRSTDELDAGALFICYRREDAGRAGRLYDHLSERFPGRVFLDVTGIAAGANFAEAIQRAIASSVAVIAVVGPDWIDARDPDGGRSLDDPDDFVRIEIRTALERDIAILPVLLPGAGMPSADDLPDDISAFAYRQAREVRDAGFAEDASRVGDDIERLLSEGRGPVVRRAVLGAAVLAALTALAVTWTLYGGASRDAGPVDPGPVGASSSSGDDGPPGRAEGPTDAGDESTSGPPPGGEDEDRVADASGADPKRPAEGDPDPTDPTPADAPVTAERVAGVWIAVAVGYTPDPGGEWAFELQPTGTGLLGTSWGWDGDRPVMEGSIDGEWIRFRTVWRNRPTYAGETTYRDWWTDYRGRVFVDSIRFVAQRDDGVIHRFTAYRRSAVPRPMSFETSADTIVRGEEVDLCWEVRYAERAAIEPLVGRIDPSAPGCATVRPDETTDFTLSLTSVAGLTRRVTARVVVTQGR